MTSPTTPTPYYEREGVRLYLGDCRDVLPTLDSGSVDAVVTDPPYGVGFEYATHDDTRDGYEEFCRQWFFECRRVAGTILMACGAVNVPMWAKIEPFKWQLCWLKPAAMGRSPFGFCNHEPMLLWGRGVADSVDVFTAPIVPDKTLAFHPCPKPERWGVESLKRVPGDSVLDPFMGSGTVGVAAIRMGRTFTGIELDEQYIEHAAKRLDRILSEPRLPFVEERPEVQAELFSE